jgi:hypothetical protein
MNHLDIIEIDFGKSFQDIDETRRQRAGALLPIIPNREKWEDFVAAVKTEWHVWRRDLIKYQKCLVILYGGLAFYEYDENTFWPQFYKAVGSDQLPANQQTEINIAFSKSAEGLGLKIRQSNKGTEYVGSAVYYIGIPLSLWEGFLDICEWARVRTEWREDWEELKDEEWAETVDKRAGGRKRLKNFLIDNREAATAFIKEILDARQILSKNRDYTISDLKQACFLRPEYFDEVPETAEFLRPENPESLFQDRVRLICNLQHCRISLHLPAVKKDKLPAIWSIGTYKQKAATTPDKIDLDSRAFDSTLLVKLDSEERSETQRVRGISPWGVFDLEKGGLVNPKRQQLPLRGYVVISPEKVEVLSRKGFDEEEYPCNETFELSDGTSCFKTELWPNGKYAELYVKHGDSESKIQFRARTKIEARFFVGRGNRAANFSRVAEDKIKTDTLPTLCLVIPSGYFQNIKTALNDKFRVLMDGKPAGGMWEKHSIQSDDEKEYYRWDKWRFIEQKKTGILKDIKQLSDCFGSPDLKGDHIFSIKSPEFKIEYHIAIEHSPREIRDCWTNLPGAFLLWFLLCQSSKGMKWDDLLLAKDIIAPNEPIAWKLLGKYYKKGFFEKRGHYWTIFESRAAFKNTNGNSILQYCGDPSILWGLYRRMCKYRETLPLIEVIDKRREVPYLEMTWARYRKDEIEKYLRNNSVVIGETLWTH